MKKISICATMALLAVTAISCKHDDIATEVDYLVTLSPENTYKAGEPVVFDIDGSVDNLVFYSGENGAQYRYKDRHSVPIEDVNSASLNLQVQARYGYAGGLDIYVSKDFNGLSGTDAAADKATVKAMVDGGMQGWQKLDYTEGASTKWTSQDFDLNDYLENLCIAFHWHPVMDGKSAQRTYWVNGTISLDLEGTEPTTMSLSDLNMSSIMMNDEISDPYVKNGSNGTICFNKQTTANIVFQGVSATALTYGLDGWVFTTPSALNKVANDQGTVIKNLQNYMTRFEYTYSEPGTYKATFVGINANYAGSSRDVQELTINVME